MAENVKSLRRRLRSIKNTKQITRAMEMVSAAKLRRAQDLLLAGRPYASKLQELLGRLALGVGLVVEGLPGPDLLGPPAVLLPAGGDVGGELGGAGARVGVDAQKGERRPRDVLSRDRRRKSYLPAFLP